MRSLIDHFANTLGVRSGTMALLFPMVALFLLTANRVTGTPRASEEEEHILRQLWQRHQTNTTEHAHITEICARIEARYPDYAFLPIVRGIAAWHYLQDGRIDESANLWLRLENDASRDPMGRASLRMARTWLTRIDREQVRKALRKVYSENVRYPKTLEPLRAIDSRQQPPLLDRWGDPWIYEWAQFRFLNVSEGQQYRLESANIRTTSNLHEALNIGYGAGLTIRPVRLLGSASDRQTLEFKTTTTPAESVTLTHGASYQGQSLVYVGSQIVILADTDHWGIFSRPNP